MSPPPTDADPRAVEAAVRRFEAAWRTGPRLAIDDHPPDPPALGRAVLVELVDTELELRLKAGETARVEEYLTRYPVLADRDAAAELAAAEFELRRRTEPALTADHYFARFPDRHAALADRFGQASTAPAAPPSPDPPPDVPGYAVEGLPGRGGVGVVYRAVQLSLDRPVALELLPAACARDPDWLDRFRREALTASALNHPNICTIHDAGDATGRPFISMELVAGRGLDELVRDRPDVPTAVGMVRQVARALAEAGENPFDLARALYFAALTHLCRREPGPVRELAAELSDLCREHGFPLLVAGSDILSGWALAADGAAARACR